MVEAFVAPSGDTGADFTGITEVRELFVQEVVHQAFGKRCLTCPGRRGDNENLSVRHY